MNKIRMSTIRNGFTLPRPRLDKPNLKSKRTYLRMQYSKVAESWWRNISQPRKTKYWQTIQLSNHFALFAEPEFSNIDGLETNCMEPGACAATASRASKGTA